MITLLKHRTTLTYLAYLGYPEEPRTSALLITRPRKYDRRRGESSRNVFLCYVCGAAGSGKTSLLRSFASTQFDDKYVPTEKVLSVVNSVDIHGSEKYLVVGCICCKMSCLTSIPLHPQLQEFGSKFEPEVLRHSKKTDLADVIVYVHDSSDTNSFSYISNFRVSTS
jgi:Ras family protein T1